MTYHMNCPAILRRGTLVLFLMCSLNVFALAGGNSSGPSAARLVAKDVRSTVSGEATRIIIAGTAPMAYSVRRPAANLLVVELPGVDASRLASTYSVASPLVSSMTVRRETTGASQSSTSLQIALRAPVRERTHLSENDLVLELLPEQAHNNSVTATALKTDAPAVKDSVKESADATAQNALALNNAPQTSQGQRYGQPGFVGEPINLNVVNADIRDILNYITEQYGVNFVVDSSVGKVPVTINVTEVPWNVALDAILKANRLGIEVTGNILRVATQEVLVLESKNRAAEEGAQSKLKDALLNNSPLVTEIIRLNYARALGTLGQVSEGTAVFTGGANNADQSRDQSNQAISSNPSNVGILPIIQRRLSRRGSVEVDGRSNTLIITDVRENIEAVKQLVMILDQPEPQVEIETRIVVANRSFSRDLGVQLNAIALSSRGGNAGFNTAPGSPSLSGQNTIGPRPTGIPQGILDPTRSLGATAASTVIGLTTGLIGTAQISALITAAEAKGQAKIVATPRVTALNNRPAQIESGSQIPVVTPQSSGSGAVSVFTTTFISVPLRLSITPQITDAGTVVLRVVMENNSVNLSLTNSLGTPGIDTQRMTTEVLVPDGGTTVVGGVLNDRESETTNRTPGLGGIPVLGNLFKRKAVSRSTDEILFFITPRIYRPDYQGRRTETAPANGSRSTQINQPVPLGNPDTNTPVPAPSQQQQPNPNMGGQQLQPTTPPATAGERP
ncbi:MAG: type IV pilus secretin PilQ [Acidobacteria bacterium]|nr:type IV pilus secretin PilQ [Acidobacteriota bacterium]